MGNSPLLPDSCTEADVEAAHGPAPEFPDEQVLDNIMENLTPQEEAEFVSPDYLDDAVLADLLHAGVSACAPDKKTTDALQDKLIEVYGDAARERLEAQQES